MGGKSFTPDVAPPPNWDLPKVFLPLCTARCPRGAQPGAEPAQAGTSISGSSRSSRMLAPA